jgi:hypothetical protein
MKPAGRERLHIQEEEDAIRREFKSKKPAASAPTGMEIQDTTLRSRIGGDIEDTKLNPNFGGLISTIPFPHSTVGESPARGEATTFTTATFRIAGTDLQ